MRPIRQKTGNPGALVICALFLLAIVHPAHADEPVVRAVLFYSPTCPHCHQVITQDLPPLIDKYGDKLQIVGVNVADAGGQALYQAAIQRYNIPNDRLGVPTLIIDDIVLVGSGEIPQQLPGLIEQYLAQGGVDWPDIPGLAEAIAAAETPPTATPPAATPEASPSPAFTAGSTVTPAPTATPSGLIIADNSPPGLSEKIARDPAGNALAIVVLLGMVCVVGYVGVAFRRLAARPVPKWQTWVIPVLALAGLGVAGYLAFVETRQVAAVCGPVGDCNTVQQSKYALLFGFLHVGVLGVIGYIAILIAWLVDRYGRGQLAQLAPAALFAMTLFGTLFSIYLTFLEPFVIGATCAWCLTSAIVMTALLWLTAAPGARSILNCKCLTG